MSGKPDEAVNTVIYISAPAPAPHMDAPPASDMIALAQKALLPFFKGNENTGNQYEIVTILYILRKMGLTNAEIDSLEDYFSEIRKHNPAFLASFTKHLASLPVGDGFFIEGRRAIDLRNATQNEADGATGDLIVILDNGEERSFSITEGAVKRDGSIEKCLSNPSCKRFGCDDEMISDFNAKASQTVTAYKTEMAAKYGPVMDSWKPREKTRAREECIAYIASKTCMSFNARDQTSQATILEDILQVKDGPKPADYLVLISTNLKKASFWSFGSLKITPSEYNMSVCGDNMEVVHKTTGDVIGKTQVKFNNGVWKKDKKDGKWKTSSATSSWNAKFVLNKVFEMSRINPLD